MGGEKGSPLFVSLSLSVTSRGKNVCNQNQMSLIDVQGVRFYSFRNFIYNGSPGRLNSQCLEYLVDVDREGFLAVNLKKCGGGGRGRKGERVWERERKVGERGEVFGIGSNFFSVILSLL